MSLDPMRQDRVTIERFQYEINQQYDPDRDDTNFFPCPPAVLLAKADGTAYEMAYLVPYANRYYTAPWLRGAYNTTPTSFDANKDLIIGWWRAIPAPCPQRHHRQGALPLPQPVVGRLPAAFVR